MRRIWDFLRKHLPIVLAGIAATVIAYFLFIKPGSQQGQSQSPGTVSFPPNPGGGTVGGGGAPLPPVPVPPVAPVPPFNPDWSILTMIKGAKLKNLYTQLFNLETQANAAFVAGNQTLFSTLSNSAAQIQSQINSFVPLGKKPTPQPQPKTAPTVTTADIRNSLNFFGKWLAQNPGASLANVQSAWQQTWAGYKQTPGFVQFVNNGWQAYIAGHPQPPGPGQLGGGPIQSFVGFRQGIIRSYDQLADKPTQAPAQTGSHLRVVA